MLLVPKENFSGTAGHAIALPTELYRNMGFF